MAEEKKNHTIRTRVAPSPTGYPHLGLIYQALFDFVFAKGFGGKFVLRIEDTDRSRYVEGAEDVIYDALSWVGLLPDEGPKEGGVHGPYRQSERLDIYQKHAQLLIENGYAYRCFCTKERLEQMRKEQEKNHLTPMYDKTCRDLSHEQSKKNIEEQMPFVIRMIVPKNEKIIVHDEITGDVIFDSNQIDDQVIVKSDGYPTYHLAVVVDDYLMQITHVFRGTEWLPSAPKHVLLYRYFGWSNDMPKFIHIPVLLNSQGGGKLSKRLAHTSVDYYKNEGFLPEAVVNYLANIVWNHPDEKEIFPIMDFVNAFTLDPFSIDIKANGVKFDLQKLLWINGMYIREVLSTDDLLHALVQFDEALKDLDNVILKKLVAIAKTRIKTLKEFKEMIDPFLSPQTAVHSDNEKELLHAIACDLVLIEDWNKETIGKVLIEKYIKGGTVTFKQLYTMLIQTDKGLPLADVCEVLGKERTLSLFHYNE